MNLELRSEVARGCVFMLRGVGFAAWGCGTGCASANLPSFFCFFKKGLAAIPLLQMAVFK